MGAKQVEKLNQHYKESSQLYHELAKASGLSDCAFWILYALYDEEGHYSQQSLCEYLSYSKQTLNSSVTKLKNEGLVVLRPMPEAKNQKAVVLTERGKTLASEAIGKVKKMESLAFEAFDKEARTLFLKFNQEYVTFLKVAYEKTFLTIDSEENLCKK